MAIASAPCIECRGIAFARCRRCGAPICDMTCALHHQQAHAGVPLRTSAELEAEADAGLAQGKEAYMEREHETVRETETTTDKPATPDQGDAAKTDKEVDPKRPA